jgi:hypothetical protein
VSKRVSRNALRVVEGDDDTSLPDLRARQHSALSAETEEARAVVEDMLGPDADRRLIEILASARIEIRHAWVASAKSFLQIGRTLLRLEAEVPRGVFDQFIDERRVLPFGRASATKMMSVARAVDLGRIQQERVPPYTVAYELVTLPDHLLRLADERGLVRPDVKRDEITAFKLAARADVAPARIDVVVLRRERHRLQVRRQRYLEALQAIEQRLAEIDDTIQEAKL